MQAGEGECNGLILCRYRFRAALRKVLPNAALCCSVLLSDLMPGNVLFAQGIPMRMAARVTGRESSMICTSLRAMGKGWGR